MWNLGSKEEVNVEGAVWGTFNNTQGYMQFSPDYFHKSLAEESLNLCSKTWKLLRGRFHRRHPDLLQWGEKVQASTNNGQEQR